MNFFGYKLIKAEDYNNLINAICRCDSHIRNIEEQIYTKAMELRSEKLQRTLDRLETGIIRDLENETFIQEMILNFEEQYGN